ncbi:hypothetical protein ES702_02332 [subsurface metagenome]
MPDCRRGQVMAVELEKAMRVVINDSDMDMNMETDIGKSDC